MIRNKDKTIAVMLPQLRGYGIQRMRINLATELSRRGFKVDLVVSKRLNSLEINIPESIEIVEIAPTGSIWFFIGLLRYLRVRHPEYVLSAHEDIAVMVLIAKWIHRCESFVLISCHNSLSRTLREGGIIRRFRNGIVYWLMRRLYCRADALVAVSKGVAGELSRATGVPLKLIRVIKNPVIPSGFIKQSERVPRKVDADYLGCTLVGYFGRLHPQKRVDLLIRAFAKSNNKEICDLLIVGEGVEEAQLKVLVDELRMGSHVNFHGYSDDPIPLMKKCKLIVLPSEYEGLGNVLIEALACGIQVVATDCPHGPGEILEGGKWGQLVPVGDTGALSAAIDRSLSKEFWVEPMRLRERGMEFSVEVATDEYLRALQLESG